MSSEDLEYSTDRSSIIEALVTIKAAQMIDNGAKTPADIDNAAKKILTLYKVLERTQNLSGDFHEISAKRGNGIKS